MARIPCFLLCGCLAACSGSPSSGHIANDAGSAVSDWVALDLDTGQVEPVTVDAQHIDPAAWSGSRILFRQMAPLSGQVGRPVTDQLSEADERPLRQASSGLVWMGVFELTQRQWVLLAGSTPWNAALPFGDIGSFTSDRRPAMGLAPAEVEAVLSDWSGNGWSVDLPDSTEWEFCCLAGATTKFAWGNSLGEAETHAVCDPAGSGLRRPDEVGSKTPNAWSLYDMHGSVWEIVRSRDGYEARGGAWDQPALACRASNRLALNRDTAAWTVGARLVLRR